MRAATFNLESFGSEKLEPEELAPRIAALRPQLEALEADILCLQEVNAQHVDGQDIRAFTALDALLKGTRYETFHRVWSLRADGKGPADRHSIVIVSRHPLEAAQSLWWQRVDPPLWRPVQATPALPGREPFSFDRPILQTAARLPDGRKLHLFSVHMRAPIAAPIPGGKASAHAWNTAPAWAEGLFLASMKRIAQALELRLAIDAVFDAEDDPLIFAAGDFNAGGVEPALRIIAADPEETGNPALRHRHMRLLDRDIDKRLRHSVLHHGRGRMLDHILASPRLAETAGTVRVLNARLEDEADSESTVGSYHAPVVAEFDLNSGGS
ncbi:endonuclease [Stappia sp. GBMRC 2046]|uniref:Endonuclease n=1 Tax=Stappia sediminis TaxID=2692190 RepID=A0A7X3LU35_9HYPH|nr:endonuclease/exonuclease/phosphatase family protein [Stappia sediminis]MXN65078.1 endonuclease [Stappia sediminis]